MCLFLCPVTLNLVQTVHVHGSSEIFADFYNTRIIDEGQKSLNFMLQLNFVEFSHKQKISILLFWCLKIVHS